MKKRLMEYQQSQKNVSIYTDETNTEIFINGYVVGVDDHDFLIRAFTPNGLYDGYILRSVDDVFRLEVDSQYNEAMIQLIGNDTSHEPFVIQENELLIDAFLRWIKTKGLVLSVHLHQPKGVEIIGYIEEIDENTCTIRQLDFYGQEDGTTVIDIDCITEVYCDTDTEQRLKRLHEINT